MNKYMDHLSGVSQEMINSTLNDYAKRCEQLRTQLQAANERIQRLEKIRLAAEGMFGSMCRIMDGAHFPPTSTETIVRVTRSDSIVVAINDYWLAELEKETT